MGVRKHRLRMKNAIPGWKCEGFFGYGHGRALAQYGSDRVGKKSVCVDLCPIKDACRTKHHERMDVRYPEIADIVHRSASGAAQAGQSVVRTVITAMRIAETRNVSGTKEIKSILSGFGVNEMTDHYMCGQFENIQNGIDRLPPTNARPVPQITETMMETKTDDASTGTVEP